MLAELWVQGVRNLQDVRIRFGEGLNLVVGANGSGKTSLLEACHVLGLGRSFRTGRLGRVVRSGTQRFAIGGELWDPCNGHSRVGVDWEGQRRSRLNGQWLEGHWEVARRMPVLGVHADSFELLSGAPEERRRLLDWGSFYLHEGFVRAWQTWRRAHEQRNAALRQHDADAARRFEPVAAKAGSQLTEMRRNVVTYLEKHLQGSATQPLQEGLHGVVEMVFRKGWAEGVSLLEAYGRSRASDAERGFGQSGPQKADLEIRIDGRPVREASRGEQKRILNALVVAQGLLLVDASNEGARPLLLLDDAAAEMDRAGIGGIMATVRGLGWQCLATTLDEGWARRMAESDSAVRMFHVEHGRIVQVAEGR